MPAHEDPRPSVSRESRTAVVQPGEIARRTTCGQAARAQRTGLGSPAADRLSVLLQRSVSQRASTRVLQRALTINNVQYAWGMNQRTFTIQLQRELSARGYAHTNRLNEITAVALGWGPSRKDEINSAGNDLALHPFGSWDLFIDHLANAELISARLPSSRQPRKRARKLGTRPGWGATVTNTRVKGSGLAARHVLPSHFLGWAVETWDIDASGLADWIGAAKKSAPALFAEVHPPRHDSVLALKRYVWQILHNHPGNLWWGPSNDNTVIGFMAPFLETMLDDLSRREGDAAVDVQEALTVVEKLQSAAGASQFSAAWNILVEAIKALWVDGAGTITFGDLLEAVEDTFFQLETDPTEVAGFEQAKELYRDIERDARAKPRGDALLRFLSINWIGSIATPIPPVAITAGGVPDPAVVVTG